jgi:formylglycine-generating enzyme required for sulfatase activity/3',5'-cyclic AMP phosphodiesterase CpdA
VTSEYRNPEASTATRSIVVLHLSDLQFGKNHRFAWQGAADADPEAAFDTLLARLQQDLRELKDGDERALVPDLIVLTGDLAEWGRKSEFEHVLRFTRSLTNTWTPSSKQCVIVPGNHDINRDSCEGYFKECKGDEMEPEPPYWPKWKHFDWLFRELHGRDSKVQFSQDMPWSLYVFDELRVVVAALNSTMRESHRDEDHYGWLGERQLRWFDEELARYQERGWLRIAALHHNLRRGPVRDDENLRDADHFARILGGRVNIILHGHTHDGNLDWLPGPHRVPILATGSAAVLEAARPPEVPNQYQMLRIWPDRIERWTRGYAPDRKRWIGDTRLDSTGNAWHGSLSIGFVDVAATFPMRVPESVAPRSEKLRSSVRDDYASHLPAYAAWAYRHFEHLPMVGLGDGDLELTLDEVYVPLGFAPRERDVWGLGHSKEHVYHEASQSVDLREAFGLAGDRHLFVRGEPGTGKTTALKKLLWSLLSVDSGSGFDGRALGLPADTVPVFVRMRELAGPALDRDFGEVLNDVLAAATRSDGHAGGTGPAGRVAADLGRWLWHRGGVLLLLDGLDEIASREVRGHVCRRVEKLAEEGGPRGIRVVASSRFAGIEREGAINLDRHRFLHLDVQPLDDTRTAQLVERWYEAAGRARARMRRAPEDAGAARGRGEARRLLDALERDVSIKLKELAGTPLYLTLLCLVTECGGQMPERRVDFFRACLEVLLGQRAIERAGERLLTADESLDLLGAVAWGMHKKRQQYDLDEHSLRDLLTGPLSRLQNQRTRKPAVTFKAVSKWFLQASGVLVEHAEGEYGFGHLGMQEYLAARHAATYPGEGIEMLVEHFESSWWREVALLFVALPGYRHFGPLMKGVIARGKLRAARKHVEECLLEAHGREVGPFVELIANRKAAVDERVEALRLVRDQADDELIELASKVAVEPLPEEAVEIVVPAWKELRLLAEQVEAHAPRREESSAVEESVQGVLVICHEGEEARARELERSMKGWGWEARVVRLLRVEHEPWRQARAFVVLAGPGRGPWQEAESRQCLVEMVRRGVSMVSALRQGTEASTLPAFLQAMPQASLGENVLESRLPAVLAGMLEVTVPELSVSLIVAGQTDEEPVSRNFVEERTGMRFLWVPGGRFWMGSGADEEDTRAWEKPRHLVEVSGYWLAETPVTNGQYEIFMREQRGIGEPRKWRDRKYNQPEQPVVSVSWVEAREFCRWLSERSGQRMVLPTEAQWERAARGDNGRKYPWGEEDPDGTRAHYGKSWEDDAPLPVGSLPAGRGPYGHQDLAGNVWEWCHDAWDDRAYEKRGELTVDPEVSGAADGNPGEARACRGGAFGNEPRGLRSACRFWYLADDRSHGFGFRVAALPAPPRPGESTVSMLATPRLRQRR